MTTPLKKMSTKLLAMNSMTVQVGGYKVIMLKSSFWPQMPPLPQCSLQTRPISQRRQLGGWSSLSCAYSHALGVFWLSIA